MNITKTISVILLAAYLIFSAGMALFGFQPTPSVDCLLGLAAVGSGILMLVTAKRFLYLSEK